MTRIQIKRAVNQFHTSVPLTSQLEQVPYFLVICTKLKCQLHRLHLPRRIINTSISWKHSIVQQSMGKLESRYSASGELVKIT